MLGKSFEATSELCAVGASYVSNLNNGYGVYIRVYSGGAYIRSRLY